MIRHNGDDFQTLRPWLRDGVDVYVSTDSVVHFVFLSTRKRIRIRAAPPLIESLGWLDGSLNTSELESRFAKQFAPTDSHHAQSFPDFIRFLYDKGVVVRKDWMSTALRPQYVERFCRQLNFFLDVEGSTDAALELFQKIRDTKVALFGLGAVGSWILKELIQTGFHLFVLVDPKRLRPADRARNALFDEQFIGAWKVSIANEYVQRLALDPQVQPVNRPLDLHTDVSALIGHDVHLIINTADEPYIGATNIKLSRYCLEAGIPLLAAGGFDAHLASLSELIVPGETPCADCYSRHFQSALRNWKPISHPIKDRRSGFGGLPSLSGFAASAAVLKIIRHLSISGGDLEHGRGEFLFHKYEIDRFHVQRDPHCPACSHL